MKPLLNRLRSTGPEVRVGLVVAAVVAVSMLGSALAGDGEPPAALSAAELSELLEGEGKVVVDRQGRPLQGPDGKPLRVARDGRTLIDSTGRVLRAARGRALRIRPGGKLPRAVRRAIDRGATRRGRRPEPRPGAPARPAPTASPDRAPVTLAAIFSDPAKVNRMAVGLQIKQVAGDPRAQLDALEDHVNATGGIDGRPLVLRGVEEDFLLTYEEQADDVARQVSRGPRPLAAIAAYGRPSLLVPRLAAGDIPLLSDWSWAQSQRSWDWPDHYFSLSGVPMDVLADVYVAELQRAGFFPRGSRVGVLIWDGKWWQAGQEALERALRGAGVRAVEWAKVSAGSGGAQDLAALSQEIGAAVVRFKVRGVDRVVGIDAAGLATLMFMLAAEQRGEKFLYGLNSTHHPATLAAQENRRRQLKGAVGIGWSPMLDVPASGEPASRVAETCRTIYARANAFTGDRSWMGEYTSLVYCENVLAVREAIRLSGSATVAGLRRGLQMLGDSFDAPLNLRTRLGPGRHHGSDGFRMLRYEAGCTCFRYEGETAGF